jgi:nicotinate-nucleotide adenylyltransferase
VTREVALFGGSFNPPHMGHVYVIAHVLATEGVDELWLVPTHTHAFGKALAPFPTRLGMCRMVAELFTDRVRASSVEGDLARKGKENRTVDTLAHLAEAYPSHRFSLVIGSDLLAEIEKWKEADRIREMARLIVIHRAGHPVPDAGPPIPDVSSTWIRERLARRESVKGWVPSAVAEACESGGWYRDEGAGQS